ncbi:MAG: TetR/AcrR family transcriptional regulator [Oscillospiraceae bacterium]|nr:TetR/AcrR family transcriptional regulator [Oscillospiraceae bacterium]
MPRTKEAFEAMRESTRGQIETAALSLFARKGLAVTVDEIARAAGLSKGLLYNHYPSKEALIAELVWQATDTSSRNFKEITHNNGSVSVKIQQISSMMCQMFSDQPIGIDYFMFMVQVGMSSFQVPETARHTDDMPNPIESLAHIIEQGQTEGSVVSGDTLQLSIVYWAAFQGLCCYAITGMPLTLDPKMLSRVLLKESYL